MKYYRTLGVMMAALSLLVIALPGAAESRIEKNLELQPKGQFILESDVGSVTVTGSPRSGAHIVITSGREDLNDELEFSFSGSAGVARVTARKHKFGWSHSYDVRFEVEVPTDTRVEVHTGGGAIALSNLSGNLEAHTAGGPIRIREVTGDARIRTSGGPIDVDGLDGNLDAHTSGGGIRINGVTGYAEAKTSGGPISATYSSGNRRGGDLETSGGSIEVAIDRSANLNLDASTSGGSVSTDLPLRVAGTISPSSIHGSIGAGGEELRLHTSGGSIRIRAR